MKDETNVVFTENDLSGKEIQSINETNPTEKEVILQNDIPNEFSQNLGSSKPKKKKDNSSLITKISSSFMVAAVATVAVAVPAMSTDSKDLEVQFQETYVTDTSVSYNLYINDPSLADLDLILRNDFTTRRVDIQSEEISGTFENLVPKMEYIMQIVMPGSFGSEKVIASMNVKTLSEEDYRTARFNAVDAECRCNVDGYFHFTMDFVDNLNVFKNFKAYIEDEEGNQIYCELTQNLHEEQKILIDFKILKGNRATLYILCDRTEEDAVTPIQLFKGSYSI